MPNPWDNDEVIGGNPWDADPVVSPQPSRESGGRSNVQRKVTTRQGKPQRDPADYNLLERSAISLFGRPGRDFLDAAQHRVGSALQGAAELAQTGLTNAAELGQEYLPSTITRGLATTARRTLESDRQALRAREAEFQRRQELGVSPTASSVGGVVGSVLPYTVGAPAQAGTALMSRLAPAGSGLLRRGAAASAVGGTAGGIQGAIDPATGDGDYAQQKLQQAQTGAAIGSVAGPVGDALIASGLRAASAVNPQMQALYRKAQSMGIQLTPAQMTDSGFVRRLSMMLDNLPFSGAPARREAQQVAGNRELARIIGENADAVDPVVMDQAAGRIGQQFDQVFAGGMKYDPAFLRRIAALKRDANQQMDETAVRTMNNWVERLRSQSNNGQISGRTLQSLDQSARKAATGGGDRQIIAQEFRDALHSAFDRQAPADVKAAWDTARRQWAILKTLEPVVARNSMGGVPLQQLEGAINATQKGRTARARGRDGDLGTLATIGQRIKSPTSSGTAENIQSAGLGAGAIANLPMTLAALGLGGLGSRTLNSRIASEFMMRSSPGATRQAVGGVIGRPFVAPAAASQQDKKKPTPKRNR